MDCKQLREVLDLYVDGELSAESATAACSHLTECAGCRLVAEQLLAMRTALKRTVGRHEPPQVLAERIHQHLDSPRGGFLQVLSSGKLLTRLLVRFVAVIAALCITVGTAAIFSPTVRGFLADGLERVALHVDRPRNVVLEGKLLCRDCELHDRYGAPIICPRRGHHGALKTDDGKIWNFIDEDMSEKLIHDSSLLGRRIRIQGRCYREADSIWVDKYELL